MHGWKLIFQGLGTHMMIFEYTKFGKLKTSFSQHAVAVNKPHFLAENRLFVQICKCPSLGEQFVQKMQNHGD
jgi:hypothetical protein